MALTRLDRDDQRTLTAAMRAAAKGGGQTWDAWWEANERPVRLEIAAGEITNPWIAGYIQAWRMTLKVKSAPLEPGDRLKAQGLEGKIVVQTDLSTALLIGEALPDFRCQIFTEARR